MRREEYGLYIVREFEGYGEHAHAGWQSVMDTVSGLEFVDG